MVDLREVFYDNIGRCKLVAHKDRQNFNSQIKAKTKACIAENRRGAEIRREKALVKLCELKLVSQSAAEEQRYAEKKPL